ncbi:DUF262 domain-containing protein [Conchiformibius kuhniae]|uniref:DUF262 domain-containing protein n=1 Tax=Conchiformibius kuhniae TaxID=211502 RepID=A0A8T9MX64_9NEIS|nr:DUF262 domain-containing protein [Conchiformibius kuhniae]UOP04802.1 DUF262 domain-containing HNH endonuclease family protein [Conchiformibius kuhniae]
MSQIFKPDNLSIKQIFNDTGSFYQVPEYQRPYSWEKEQVEQLWFDLAEAYANHRDDPEHDANYFLGSVVLVEKAHGYDVVDGQQRLTTLTILFCVLRDLQHNILGQIKINQIKNSIEDLIEGKKRLKLMTQANNQALFETSVIDGIDFSAKKKHLDDNRFLQTAFYFKNLITDAQNPDSENHINDFSGFVDYIFERTTLIRIVCSDENFAIKLFTVLNDRGLDLTSADIVKAHLMQRLPEARRGAFVEVWKRIETLCVQMDETLQLLLSLYLYFLKAGNPKKILHEELKSEFKDQAPLDVVLALERFAKALGKINADKHDKDLSKLRYLPQSIYWKTILLTAKQTDYPFYHELKSLLVKYYYQSWIADGTSNRVKQLSFRIIKMVKENRDIAEIRLRILANLRQYPSYLLSLERHNIYSFKWHKPLLLAIEYHQQDDYPYIEIKKDLHTEHILPKEWNRADLDWREHFFPQEAETLLNSLGNLTLLSGNKNLLAGNRNYRDKCEIYAGKGLDGKTSFEITKRIFEQTPVQWTAETIEMRKRWLVAQARAVFDIV